MVEDSRRRKNRPSWALATEFLRDFDKRAQERATKARKPGPWDAETLNRAKEVKDSRG
jgi:hypothetical protein